LKALRSSLRGLGISPEPSKFISAAASYEGTITNQNKSNFTRSAVSKMSGPGTMTLKHGGGLTWRFKRSSVARTPLTKLVSTMLILSFLGSSARTSERSVRYFSMAEAASVEECTINEDGEELCEVAGDDPNCNDGHENCSFWAEHGECTANSNYMLKNCRKSCRVCGTKVKVSEKVFGEQEMLERLVEEYGEPQEITGDQKLTTLAVVKRTVSYMKNFVNSENPTHTMSEDVAKSCKNRNELCSFWAAIGECEENPAFMATNCAPSCRSCHKIDFATRCPPLGDDAIPGLEPGGLNAMFERIVATAPGTQEDAEKRRLDDNGSPLYTVTVHSRPAPVPETEEAVSKGRDLDQPPWAIAFDNFLTEDECEHIIQLGYKHGYKRSRDVGKQTFDGSFDGKESTSRTSENAWCSDRDGCRKDEVAHRIHQRLANTTGIPAENYEDFQLLKYEVGQFYRTHHDYIGHQRDRPCGPRILTFFLYLSDVEEGGGTNFPDLTPPITVYPRKGRALLWPSVLDSEPLNADKRTRHQALPVEKGTKFAANAWIHQFDYLQAHSKGCS